MSPKFLFAAGLIGSVISIFPAFPVFAEQWTDVRGARTITARMIGLWSDAVVLEIDGNRRVAVPMSGLQGGSRIQARSTDDTIAKTRATRIAALKKAAAIANAPAPDPLPAPPPVPDAAPYPAPATLDDYVRWQNGLAKSPRSMAILTSFPESQQQKITAIAAKYATAMGPAKINAIAASLHKAAAAIWTKQNWFLSHPRFENLPGEQTQFLRQIVIPTAGMIYAATDPSVLDAEKIAAGELKDVLRDIDTAAAGFAQQLIADSRMDLPRPSVAEIDGKTFLVQPSPIGDQRVEMTQVDGKWVSATSDATLDEVLKSADDASAVMAAMPIDFSMITVAIDGAMSPLQSAANETAYHQAMETLITTMQAAAPSIGAMMPSMANGMQGSSSSGYPAGYDSSYPTGYDGSYPSDSSGEQMR